jgi:hypothetical protein
MDAHAADSLGGLRILSSHYGNGVVQALGYPRLKRDEFLSVPERDLDRLSEPARRQLTTAARRRYGL